jgi:hypothetical protein
MKTSNWSAVSMIGVCIAMLGCGASDRNQTGAAASVIASPYVASAEPAGVIPVGEARQSVENDQKITVVGLIGGSPEPFVNGLAAFTIVDPKVPYCAPDEGCPTPWDYCCTQDQVKDNIATVKVVDKTGNPVAEGARVLLGVQELSTVVVEGKAKRDDHGNLTIAASKVFVRKP